MLLFSATFEDSVWKFAQKVVPDPNIIKLKREEETLDTIKQYYVLCNNRDEKFQALCNLYGAITIAQAMIFCHVSSSGSGRPAGGGAPLEGAPGPPSQPAHLSAEEDWVPLPARKEMMNHLYLPQAESPQTIMNYEGKTVKN